MNVDRKVIIVSGATSGIGLTCASTLAAAGHCVHGFGRDPGRTPETDGVTLHQLDIRDRDGVTGLVARIAEQEGRIDGVVNAAGLLVMDRAHKVKVEDYDRQMDVMVKGAFGLIQAVLPVMTGQKAGLVVNIGSVTGTRAAPGMSVYGAAKAALQHLTTSLAAEYAAKGVRFMCVNPGPVETELMEPLMYEMLAKKVPLGRVARADEVAAAVKYLFADEAAFMTGSTLTIDGGAAL
jgi:NAD(P)-dependent dehydrogenase (short-subunit alcohol dehydrogenase family)